jgi:YbbR domain-containing protein
MKLSWVTDNLGLRIFSLIVAVVLYLFVNLETVTPVEVDYPITYRVQEGLVLSGTTPRTVTVTLKGPWANLRPLSLEALNPIVVDLSYRKRPVEFAYTLTSNDIRPPSGMEVDDISPRQLQIKLEEQVTRDIPVRIHLKSPALPEPGYEVYDMKVEPSTLSVVGAKSEVDEISELQTPPLSVSGETQTIETSVEIKATQPGVVVLKPKVRVVVEIREQIIERVFRDVAVEVDSAERVENFSPEKVTLSVKGPKRVLDGLDSAALKAVVTAECAASEKARVLDIPVELVHHWRTKLELSGSIPRVKIHCAAK